MLYVVFKDWLKILAPFTVPTPGQHRHWSWWILSPIRSTYLNPLHWYAMRTLLPSSHRQGETAWKPGSLFEKILPWIFFRVWRVRREVWKRNTRFALNLRWYKKASTEPRPRMAYKAVLFAMACLVVAAHAQTAGKLAQNLCVLSQNSENNFYVRLSPPLCISRTCLNLRLFTFFFFSRLLLLESQKGSRLLESQTCVLNNTSNFEIF